MFRGMLGRNPSPPDKRDLRFATYSVNLPEPPPSTHWAQAVPSWLMDFNDTVGDCTCAAMEHMIRAWCSNAKNGCLLPSEADVLKAYEAITGYDPRTGANDDGANMRDVLKYWQKTGLAGHKIAAYVAVNPRNKMQVQQAIWLFGGVYAGLDLALSQQKQKVWDVPRGGAVGKGEPRSWGGHCVPFIDYDAKNPVNVTWGALKKMTWPFVKTYCSELYATLTQDWIDAHGKSPSGFDLPTLMSDLKAVQG